jgi:hypothetical protein
LMLKKKPGLMLEILCLMDCSPSITVSQFHYINVSLYHQNQKKFHHWDIIVM